MSSLRTEKEKMLGGEWYDPLVPELVHARDRTRDLCQDLNVTRERDQDARRSILKQLFGQGGESVWMQPPFYCDYGSNILLVTRDIPDQSFAAGNPCRVIRKITE